MLNKTVWLVGALALGACVQEEVPTPSTSTHGLSNAGSRFFGANRTCVGNVENAGPNQSYFKIPRMKLQLAFDSDTNARTYVFVEDEKEPRYWGIINLKSESDGSVSFQNINSRGQGYSWRSKMKPAAVWPVKGTYAEYGVQVDVKFHCT
jgi:hypothetical protein